MKLPAHLRLSFYACICYTVRAKEGTAWAEGGRDEIDLDYENLLELEALGVITLREIKSGPRVGTFMATTLMTDAAADEAWKDTFSDEPYPEHPGFYGREIAIMKSNRIAYASAGAVEGVDGVFALAGGALRVTIPTETEVVYNEHGEILFFHGEQAPLPDRGPDRPRYTKGRRAGWTTADASYLATLRCVIEDRVYSSGHLYCEKIENAFRGKGYGPVLDSSALYVMLRFGIVEVTQEYIKGEQSEGYGVTEMGRVFYDKLNAVKERLDNGNRYNEIAKAMAWEN